MSVTMVTDKIDEPKKTERSTALVRHALLRASARNRPTTTKAGVVRQTNHMVFQTARMKIRSFHSSM
jgi:hypothetical protein